MSGLYKYVVVLAVLLVWFLGLGMLSSYRSRKASEFWTDEEGK